jgi:hypothetical protein
MTTKKNALVKRLSLCRKRIMDELGPSTLYALTEPPPHPIQLRMDAGCVAQQAQLSLNAILCHYSLPTGGPARPTAKKPPES